MQQAAVLAAMATAAIEKPGERISPMAVRSLIALIVLRIHATDVHEALTAGETGTIDAAVKLSRSWPSAPSSAQPYRATELDAAKRRVEAQLVMMEPDASGRVNVPEHFMDRYKSAGGDEWLAWGLPTRSRARRSVCGPRPAPPTPRWRHRV